MSEASAAPDFSTVDTRAGMVAIIGQPNAGKSSLLNHLVETKLSIVSPSAQTTRERVVGIDTRGDTQMVFLDTPGLVDPAYLLHRAMLGIIEETLDDADVVVLLLDGMRPPPDLSDEVVERLASPGTALVVGINKVDAAHGAQIRALRQWAGERFDGDPLEISAATGSGVGALRQRIEQALPRSPFLYPQEDISTQPVRFFVAELVREAVFELYAQEIPYSVAVKVEEFREHEDPIFIRAVVFVERASQKGILIGRGGGAIRQLGTAARRKIEEFVGSHVYLDLWVKVLPRWRKSALELQRLGFSVPESTD